VVVSEFDDAYRSAKSAADWAMENVQGLGMESTGRNRLASAAYGLALEHHRAMVLLVETKSYGSTLALLRPAVEGFARGYWLLYQADENQLSEFAKGRMTLTLDVLLRHIAEDGSPGPQKGKLQQLVRRLNELTHGGIEHLIMRQGQSVVGPQYRIEDMANGLEIGTWVAKMSALDMVGGIAGETARAQRMVEEMTLFD
jgi:hypothetical protein